MVKQSINKAIGRIVLTLEAYSMLICEAKAIVNTRPLKSLYDDPQSLVLRPTDFQLSNRSSFLSAFADEEDDLTYLPPSDRDSMLEDYQTASRLMDKFWHIWGTEHLQSL